VSAPDEPVLLSDDRDGIRTLTLNRPQRKNAIDARLWRELAVPTVAKLTGVEVGAGWNLALGCDFVVATPESRFCQIFAKRGLSVDLGGAWLLPKLVGLQQAKRLVLLADMIDAAEAHALGLVTWVTPADEIDAFVDDLAGRLAAGPVALAQSKALLNDGANATFAEAVANEARAQPGNFATADSGEAYAAFAAKREPEFTGQWMVPPPRGQERSDSGDGTRGQERSDPGDGTRSEQDNA
jgi:2-(1,2-epoxy-1,2-dihydrophenyl)acetyl-CoA isomerase